ncbi:ATPase AAA [Spirochaetia bacterium]|nr:ATPase AAA [Spirochaetia bacterium]
MADTFIIKIQIDKVRHLENLTIELSDKERKHLILTGKNGSGKTSVLEAMRDYIVDEQQEAKEPQYMIALDGSETPPKPKPVEVKFNNYRWHDTPFYYFAADHKLKVSKPTAIEKVDLKTSDDIVKYMVFQNYQRMAARDKDNTEKLMRIDKWFDSFLQILRNIYECPQLELQHIEEELDYKIILPTKKPFGFDEMSDGYSAAMRIILDLAASMENQNNNFTYNQLGIVLIDEIETHLHVELQKKVLPFLTTMFPNIQFIVTTHSPFVITSLSNAVVYDLENQERLENLSAYSYDGIVEYYFDAQKYSDQAKTNFEEYKTLVEKKERTESEDKRLAELITYFRQTPILGSPEIMNAFFASELERRSSVNG